MMYVRHDYRRQRREAIAPRFHNSRGQMMVVFALTISMFVGALVLGVDISRLRTEAERIQRAADAAALAGVIYMPDFYSNASSRAKAEARKNGFVDDPSNPAGVHVTPASISQYPTQLKVTISAPVSLIFGNVFGLGSRTISRSAVAQYDEPLQMGSPDYVLGYAPYPTTMVSGGTEGFYLENKGRYTYKESGDAHSPEFESFSGKHFLASGDLSAPNNPCTIDTNGNCADSASPTPHETTPNNDNGTNIASSSTFQGYDYIIDDPIPNNTLIVKLFDPFDEIEYDTAAKSFDAALNCPPHKSCGPQNRDPSTNLAYAYAPSDSRTSSSTGNGELGTDSTGDPSSGGTCYVSVGQNCTKLIDQNSSGGNPFGEHPVTLRFSLYGPGVSVYDQNMPQITQGTPDQSNSANYASSNTACLATGGPNCVYQPSSSTAASAIWPGYSGWPTSTQYTAGGANPSQNGCPTGVFCAGEDPTTAVCTSSTSCRPSPYAYRFMNFAVIHGPGIFRLRVASSANTWPDNSEGTRGNAYGIAVCAPTGTTQDYLGATSDPYSNASTPPGWNSASCANPNSMPSNPTNCANPNKPQPADPTTGRPADLCIHVYGLGRMAIHNWIQGDPNSTTGTNALIPLGYIPPAYDGRTLKISLYDVGDISGNNDTIDVLTPAGDLTHYGTGSRNSVTQNGVTTYYPGSLPYTYSASAHDGNKDPADTGTGTGKSPFGYSNIAGGFISNCSDLTVTTNGSAVFNGRWLSISVPLQLTGNGASNTSCTANQSGSTPTPTYADMVSNFGGYWKVRYHVAAGNNADDATTWEISIGGSPVRLVSEGS